MFDKADEQTFVKAWQADPSSHRFQEVAVPGICVA
jgi:hypothetical protein